MPYVTTPLGFRKPDGNDPVRDGENHVAHNAQLTEDRLQGLSNQVASVSHPFNIGLDIDGVPFFQVGATGLTLEADTDGVPYIP